MLADGSEPDCRRCGQSTFWSIRTRLQMDGWTRDLAMLAGRLATISFHHHLPRFTELN
jgi:hypothetical protein